MKRSDKSQKMIWKWTKKKMKSSVKKGEKGILILMSHSEDQKFLRVKMKEPQLQAAKEKRTIHLNPNSLISLIEWNKPSKINPMTQNQKFNSSLTPGENEEKEEERGKR
jgi:hypothetical protein